MDIETALEAIPDGWRIYTIDGSILNSFSVTLKNDAHREFVSATAQGFAEAIYKAAYKASMNHRGWTISRDYVGYSAIHPDFEAEYQGPEDGWVGNGLHVHGMTVEQVKSEVDDKEDENG